MKTIIILSLFLYSFGALSKNKTISVEEMLKASLTISSELGFNISSSENYKSIVDNIKIRMKKKKKVSKSDILNAIIDEVNSIKKHPVPRKYKLQELEGLYSFLLDYGNGNCFSSHSCI